MTKVNICDVTVLDNPSPFKNPFQFEITFECLEDLKDGKILTNQCIIMVWKYYIDRTLIDAWIVYQEGIYHDQLFDRSAHGLHEHACCCYNLVALIITCFLRNSAP